MGSGTDVAMEAAGVTPLMRADPEAVADAIEIATGHAVEDPPEPCSGPSPTTRPGIPLAAFGLLSPVIAGAAMAFFELWSVVSNALLLRRWKPASERSGGGRGVVKIGEAARRSGVSRPR